MPEKWMRCVDSVKKQNARKGRKKVNPYAVCTASTGLTRHEGGKKNKETK